jgi:hypothetical protein
MILDFVVKTIPTVALGIVLSIGAVYLIDKLSWPYRQAETHYPTSVSH